MDIIEKYKTKYQGAYKGITDSLRVTALLDKYSIHDETYRKWLTETDGGPIASNWFDSLEELEISQQKLESEPWTIKGFVIGWDGSGNPIVIQNDNTIAVEDHDFGGIHIFAKNFKELLVQGVSS